LEERPTPNRKAGGSSPPGPATRGEETTMFERITNYFRGVRAEVARISWPTRNEIISLTALILLLVVLVTLYIAGVDLVLGTLIELPSRLMG
jgi:preprotein translocase subunit SecE